MIRFLSSNALANNLILQIKNKLDALLISFVQCSYMITDCLVYILVGVFYFLSKYS